MRILALAALSACTVSPPAESADTGADTAADTADTGECREEGEACTAYENGGSNCCNGRHTCFPEGCYYTEPG